MLRFYSFFPGNLVLPRFFFFVGIYETPAGTILYHAHLDIENFTLDRVEILIIQSSITDKKANYLIEILLKTRHIFEQEDITFL